MLYWQGILVFGVQELLVNMAKGESNTTPHFWSEEETNHFISVMKDTNILDFGDARK